MFTQKTIHGFIFVICSLYCHQIHTGLNEDKRANALVVSGLLLNAAGVYVLAVRSLLSTPRGALLFTLETTINLKHEEILKLFNNISLKTVMQKSKKFAVKIEKIKNVLFADEGDKGDIDE